MIALLEPDESANALYRRLTKASFHVKFGSVATEEFHFMENVEVIAARPEVPEFVLAVAVDFAAQVPDGFILHVSLDNSFHQSLFLSKMDISNAPLFDLHTKGHVKAITISRVSQLLALSEYIKTTFTKEKVLVLLEGLSLVLLSQKSPLGTLSPPSLLHATLTEFQRLVQIRSVTCMWVNSATPKGGIGLRDGSYRDPVSLLWKQKINKVYHYQGASGPSKS